MFCIVVFVILTGLLSMMLRYICLISAVVPPILKVSSRLNTADFYDRAVFN